MSAIEKANTEEMKTKLKLSDTKLKPSDRGTLLQTSHDWNLVDSMDTAIDVNQVLSTAWTTVGDHRVRLCSMLLKEIYKTLKTQIFY